MTACAISGVRGSAANRQHARGDYLTDSCPARPSHAYITSRMKGAGGPRRPGMSGAGAVLRISLKPQRADCGPLSVVGVRQLRSSGGTVFAITEDAMGR